MSFMSYEYIVPIPVMASKNTLYWLWWITVITRANGLCEKCRKAKKLDAAHLEPRKKAPDRAFDPNNGTALCRSCHLKYDHAKGHRPSGRPFGTKMSREWCRKHSKRMSTIYADPERREIARKRAISQWDRQGRKHDPNKPCENCGEPRGRGDRRFCSAACHYEFRTGKVRSGY